MAWFGSRGDRWKWNSIEWLRYPYSCVYFLQFSLISVRPPHFYISLWNLQIALVTHVPSVIAAEGSLYSWRWAILLTFCWHFCETAVSFVRHSEPITSTIFFRKSSDCLEKTTDLPPPHHKQNSLSQFADDTAQWAFSLNVKFAANLLQQDLLKLATWCAKWRIKLNPEKTKVIIFSRSLLARKAELNLTLYGEPLKIYSQVKFLGIIFDSKLTFQKHFEDILERCNNRYYRLRLLANKKWGPSPATIIQIYKQCVRPIFEYGSLSTITVRTTSSAKFSGSKINLFGLPCVYQNTSSQSCYMTPLASLMWRTVSSPVQPSPQIELHKTLQSRHQSRLTGSILLGTVSQHHSRWSVLEVLSIALVIFLPPPIR